VALYSHFWLNLDDYSQFVGHLEENHKVIAHLGMNVSNQSETNSTTWNRARLINISKLLRSPPIRHNFIWINAKNNQRA